MVEFAVSILGLLMLVAIIVDSCLLFHRYSLLTETAAELTRKISSEIVRLPVPQGTADVACQVLCDRATQYAQTFTESSILDDGFSFQLSIVRAQGDFASYAPYPLIKVEGSGQARCLFCSLVPWDITISSISLLVVESSTTGCLGGGALTCS